MRTTQGTMLQSLRAVQGFLEEHAERLPTVVGTGVHRKLSDTIAELVGHVGEQSGYHFASQSQTRKQRVLRRVLVRDHMSPIARIARAELPFSEEVAPLRMPRGNPGAEQLAAVAYGMAKAAAPYAGVFTSAALPADFIAKLTGAADRLVASYSDRTQQRGSRSKATKGLKSKLSAGRRLVHVLDALVRSALEDEPLMLASWEKVSRVPKVPTRASVTEIQPSAVASAA